jgi:hypothetical protein
MVSRLVLATLAAMLACGCSGGSAPSRVEKTQPTEVIRTSSFVPASRELLARCRRTARQVGYAVPCPTRVPAGLTPTGAAGPTRCALEVVGAGGIGECGKSWRGWVVGSSHVGEQHLVITASPRPLARAAKLVNGPAWYPGAAVRTLGQVMVEGRRMLVVHAPAATNAGSAFAGHVVLVWTAAGHSYGVGFHNLEGIAATRRLNEALVRGIELVEP